MHFKILKVSQLSRARLSVIQTGHGLIHAPFFMPIATLGVVRNITSQELEKNVKAQVLLANTFHLYFRPGVKLIQKVGGLHKFMGWSKPILTDSGGFQIFSLRNKLKQKDPLVQVKKDGVDFVSPFDGRKEFFTAEKVLEIQKNLGVDFAMVLDECVEYPCSRERAEQGAERTFQWARISQRWSLKNKIRPLIFGIIQGSIFKDLREKSAQKISALNFDGYAVGGLSVGESKEEAYQALDWTAPFLPLDKPHYAMGIGYPEDIVEAVKRGVDMFDCVIPTREGRHGRLFVFSSNQPQKNTFTNFYQIIKISNAEYRKDFASIDENCECILCRKYTRAYLHHLFKIKDGLAFRLGALHNLNFYSALMRKLRQAIKEGKL